MVNGGVHLIVSFVYLWAAKCPANDKQRKDRRTNVVVFPHPLTNAKHTLSGSSASPSTADTLGMVSPSTAIVSATAPPRSDIVAFGLEKIRKDYVSLSKYLAILVETSLFESQTNPNKLYASPLHNAHTSWPGHSWVVQLIFSCLLFVSSVTVCTKIFSGNITKFTFKFIKKNKIFLFWYL